MKTGTYFGRRKCLSGGALLMYCLILLAACCSAGDAIYIQIQDVHGQTEDSTRGGISGKAIESHNDYTELLTSEDGKSFSKSRVSHDLILNTDPYKVCVVYTPQSFNHDSTAVDVNITIFNFGVKDEDKRPPWSTYQPPFIIDNGNMVHSTIRLELEKEQLIPVGYIGDTGNYLSLAVKLSKKPLIPSRRQAKF